MLLFLAIMLSSKLVYVLVLLLSKELLLSPAVHFYMFLFQVNVLFLFVLSVFVVGRFY